MAIDNFYREIFFINLDLELYSKEDLTLLHDELKDRVFILHNGFIKVEGEKYYLLSLESNLDYDYLNSSDVIDKLTLNICELITKLSPESRQLWDNCYQKIFNYGYESGVKPFPFSNQLFADTIKKIASLDGSVKITIYPMKD